MHARSRGVWTLPAIAIIGILVAGCSSGTKARAVRTTVATSASSTNTTGTSSASTVPTTAARTTASAATTAAPAKPHVNIDFTATAGPPGGRSVTFKATVTGLVPQLRSDGEAQAPINGTDQILWMRIDLGDGTENGSDGGAVKCVPGAPSVPLHMQFWSDPTFPGVHTYAKAGTYTITFRIAVCQLGVVTRQAQVTVS